MIMTAVEWFNQQIVDRQNEKGDARSWDTILEQAKQLERELLEDAYWDGGQDIPMTAKACEEYFDKKFKKQ